MDKSNKDNSRLQLYDAAILIAIYVALVSIPSFGLLPQNVFTGILRFVALIPAAIFLIRDRFPKPKFDLIGLLLCIPLLFICFGNMISLFIQGGMNPNIDGLWMDGVFTFGTALVEEIIFRFALMEALTHTRVKRFSILISSGVFALCHIFALLSGSDPLAVLSQVGYTFALGLVLGCAYEIGGIVPCFIIHLLFNFFQNDLYLALGGGKWDYIFFLSNILCAAATYLYGAAILFLYVYKKRASADRENPDQGIQKE